SSGVWYHLGVTYDGSVIRYYINGVEDASASVSGGLSSTSFGWGIGDDGNNAHFFDGVVDEVGAFAHLIPVEQPDFQTAGSESVQRIPLMVDHTCSFTRRGSLI
ncbi:MAG: LamG-like jellyroll fold domain-containing protein, partial [Pirellulaceae bacterium]